MHRTLSRLIFSLCSVLLVALPGGLMGVPSAGAHQARDPKVLLLFASKHAGKVYAQLKEQVVFIAGINYSIPPEDAIAIVRLNPRKLIGICPAADTCTAADRGTKPGDHAYSAYITGPDASWRKGSGVSAGRSNIVHVEWKNLTVKLDLSGDGLKALGPAAYSQVLSAPVTETISLPDGISTSWSEIGLVWDDAASPVSCEGKAGPCRLTKPCDTVPCSGAIPAAFPTGYPPQPLTRTLRVQVTTIYNTVLYPFAPYTVAYHPFAVDLEATNKKSGQVSTTSLALGTNESGTVAVKLTEPQALKLSSNIEGVRIMSRAQGTAPDRFAKPFLDCPNETVCQPSNDIQESSVKAPILYWAEVYAKAGGTTYIIGKSGDVTVTSCSTGPLAARSLHTREPHRPPAQTCSVAKTVVVKPTLSSNDRVPLDPSFPSQGGTIDVTGAITDHFVGTDGKPETVCADALYSEIFIPGTFDCSGPWPAPTSSGPYRESSDNVTNPNIAAPLADCTAWPCSLQNVLDYPGAAYNDQHKYTLGVTNPFGKSAAFWAFPLGQPGQNQTYTGQFNLTLHP